MKTTTLVLAAALTAGAALPAFADQPGTDWMPMDQALGKLTGAGYGQVDKLKAEDGFWEARATKDGRSVEVRIDPRTGAVTDTPEKAETEADNDRD